jgi:mannose-1-phosphate guanylyltransferase
MEQRKDDAPCAKLRCGIVLSGGNGTRMREFVQRLRDDDLPKQYVKIIGKRSMLEHTFQRAEKLIPAQRLFTIVAREHLNFDEVRAQLAWRPRQTVVVQPYNRDTAAGILLPLTHLYKQYPNAVTAIFPSDHFVLEEDLFMSHVDRAFRAVESDRTRIVLLGVEPREPDPEYGYMVPGATIDDSELGARRVELFVKKPSAERVQKILGSGALWNTLVVVSACSTLLNAIETTLPELYGSFQPILEAVGTPNESDVVERVYRELQPINFSRGVLEFLAFERRRTLLVLPVRGVTWSDWGTSARVLTSLQQLGKSIYHQTKHMSAVQGPFVYPRKGVPPSIH